MKNEKKNKRKNIYVIWLIVCLILVSILIPIAINESYKKGGGYITVWDGKDVLSFYGSLIGAVGTIVLGVVAWRQNIRLLKIEENAFVSENTCSAIVSNVTVKKINQNAFNLNLHDEQIVSTKEAILTNYCSSIEFEFRLKMLNNVPVLVHISDLLVFSSVGNEKNCKMNILRAKERECDYSRVAVGEKYCGFNCTICLTKDEKDKLLESILGKNSEMLMEIYFTLMSDKMIASNYKCRIKLKCDKKRDNLNVNFIIDDKYQPICFWYGNEVIDKEDINIRDITEDKDNG